MTYILTVINVALIGLIFNSAIGYAQYAEYGKALGLGAWAYFSAMATYYAVVGGS